VIAVKDGQIVSLLDQSSADPRYLSGCESAAVLEAG
jgi:hypothetical protein